MVTISASNGAGTTTPLAVLSEYSTTRRSRNVVHDLIGGGIAVSLVAPNPRSGTLELLYDNEESAYECADLHSVETSFVLSEPDRPHMSMTYVIDGEVTVTLDADTLTVWIVGIGFQETP